MADFEDALRKGLESHKRAAEARKVMEEVLASASKAMATVTGSPISLRFQVVDRPRIPGSEGPRDKVEALTARLETAAFTVLGEVSFGELGYPVTVRWQNNRDSANDRAGFEALVETLLAHSSTGAKIAALVGSKQ